MGVRIVFSGLNTLPFRKIYAIDFEFYGKDGEIPQIVCMVNQDLRFGEVNQYRLQIEAFSRAIEENNKDQLFSLEDSFKNQLVIDEIFKASNGM